MHLVERQNVLDISTPVSGTTRDWLPLFRERAFNVECGRSERSQYEPLRSSSGGAFNSGRWAHLRHFPRPHHR